MVAAAKQAGKVLAVNMSNRPRPEVLFARRLIGATGQEKTKEFDGLGEKDLISQTTSLMSQSLSDVAFSNSR